MQLADDIFPVLTSVVKLKSYGKGEEVHVCRRSKRPHLFVLTPDVIQVFTTADADDITSSSSSSSTTPHQQLAHEPSLLSNLIHRKQKPAAAAATTAPPPPPAALIAATSSTSLSPEDPEELAEGQIFRLGVSLNQVLGVDIVKDVRVKVYYQPNRPSKKGSIEEQTMMVLRTLLRTVDVKKVGKHHREASSLPHPNAHHFTIIAESTEEALAIKDAIERSQQKLAMAVLWLSEGLPLRRTSSIVMVTVGASSVNTTTTTTTTAATANANIGQNTFSFPYPAWNAELELPIDVSGALGTPNSRRSLTTSVKIYLSTPLGPATAEIPLLSLLQSASEGSAPITTTATLQVPPEQGTLMKRKKKWQVMLQWRAIKGEALPPPVAAAAAESVGANGHNNNNTTNGGGALIGSSADGGESQGSVAVLVGLAALSGLTALVRRLRNQYARIRGIDGGDPVSVPGASQSWHKWKIIFLELFIDEETEQPAKGMPLVKRSLSMNVSSSQLTSMNSLAAPPPPENENELPHHIELLVLQYPDIITHDIALRFIVGLGSDNKAFAGLSSMAQWMTENRLVDILQRPQPAFEVMKQHYPHGFPGWSTKKDCLVELECMGMWAKAYDQIAAAGVSEKAMLEHLLFTYQYAFANLDHRPLPQGKTVKIVDLDGLTMVCCCF